MPLCVAHLAYTDLASLYGRVSCQDTPTRHAAVSTKHAVVYSYIAIAQPYARPSSGPPHCLRVAGLEYPDVTRKFVVEPSLVGMTTY